MHNPAHPGEILLDLYLKPLGVSITAAASRDRRPKVPWAAICAAAYDVSTQPIDQIEETAR